MSNQAEARNAAVAAGVNALLRRGEAVVPQKWSQAVKLAAVDDLGIAVRLVYLKREWVEIRRYGRAWK